MMIIIGKRDNLQIVNFISKKAHSQNLPAVLLFHLVVLE